MRETEADKAAMAHLAPVEPDFISQNGDLTSDAEKHGWFQKQTDEYRARGGQHFRYSHHDLIPNLILIEGWKERPRNEGEPRWALVAQKDN